MLLGALVAFVVAASVTGATFFWAISGILVLIVGAAALRGSPSWRTFSDPGDANAVAPLGDPVEPPSGFDRDGV